MLADRLETLFAPVSYRDVLGRVESIQPHSQRQWGKMTAAQMLEHAARALEMAAGKKQSKQAFLGKLIGWIFWKDFVGPKPFQRNGPTGPDFVVQGEPDFGPTKERLKRLLGEFHALGEQGWRWNCSPVLRTNDGSGMGCHPIQAPGSSPPPVRRVACDDFRS
jgi:hypothetical protein